MTIKSIQEEVIDEFLLFDDWMQKYEYMIDLGKSLPLINENNKTNDRLIKGCQSKVWLDAQLKNGKINYRRDREISKRFYGWIYPRFIDIITFKHVIRENMPEF